MTFLEPRLSLLRMESKESAVEFLKKLKEFNPFINASAAPSAVSTSHQACVWGLRAGDSVDDIQIGLEKYGVTCCKPLLSLSACLVTFETAAACTQAVKKEQGGYLLDQKRKVYLHYI